MRATGQIAIACVLWLLAAGAAIAAPNPFYDAYQGDISVTDVSVAYADGILENHSDRAARDFVRNDNFPAELRTSFEAANVGVTDDSYGERFSEFMLARALRAHTADWTGQHRVRLEIEVTDARINGMLSGALFAGAAFPRLGGSVRIFDADSGALLATATIQNSQSWAQHVEAAQQTQGFRYNFSGTDTNFRYLAGSTEAFSGNVINVLRGSRLPDPGARTDVTAYPRITIRSPSFNVTLAAQ